MLLQHFPHTYQRVRDLLQHRTGSGEVDRRKLSEVAVFPDCAKNEEEYCGRKPSAEEIDYVLRNLVHKQFHFTNSPFGQKQYLPTGIGASNIDIVRMITFTANQLRNRKQSSKQDVKLTATEALWLLAHLVGDVHQPLHVGQAYYATDCKTLVNPNDPADKGKGEIPTFGGNSIKFEAPHPAVPLVPSLHIYWDSVAVARAMQADGLFGDEQAFARMLATAPPPPGWENPGDPEKWAERWYSEVVDLAQQAYTREGVNIIGTPESGSRCKWTVTLDKGYEDWARERAREQLRKAGFRLAAVLVAIFPDKAKDGE